MRGDFGAVCDPQMPEEHLRAKPALEANHIILLDRGSDRHRAPGRLSHGRGTPDTGKRSTINLASSSAPILWCRM